MLMPRIRPRITGPTKSTRKKIQVEFRNWSGLATLMDQRAIDNGYGDVRKKPFFGVKRGNTSNELGAYG